MARPEQPQKLGKYRGFEIHVESHNGGCQFVLEGAAGYYTPMSLIYDRQDKFSVGDFIQRLDNYWGKFENHIQDGIKDLERKTVELANARQSLGQAFPQKELLNTLRQDNRDAMNELLISQNNSDYVSTWEPKSRAMTTKTLEGEVSSLPAGLPGPAGLAEPTAAARSAEAARPTGLARPAGVPPSPSPRTKKRSRTQRLHLLMCRMAGVAQGVHTLFSMLDILIMRLVHLVGLKILAVDPGGPGLSGKGCG